MEYVLFESDFLAEHELLTGKGNFSVQPSFIDSASLEPYGLVCVVSEQPHGVTQACLRLISNPVPYPHACWDC